MCSQSVSGSSLLSGYDEDDARETSGRSRREFEQIDAVLYDEEVSKRSSIKKICEEWSSKPHFRIRGRLCHINRQENLSRIGATTSNTFSTFDFLSSNLKMSSLNSNELNVLIEDTNSGRSSIDSIEGSDLINNSDLDDDDLDDADATNTIVGDHFSGGGADSFDTDDDDDENGDFSSNISTRDRIKHPQFLIKCLKDSIISSLASSLLQQFLADQQPLLQRYAKYICAQNSVTLRPKLRPYSLPPRSLSQNRYSLPIASSMISTNTSLQQHPMMIPSLAFRGTPELNIELNDLLRVTPLRIINPIPIGTGSTSPRKSQTQVPPPQLPIERTSTSLAIEKRNQQQISLIGTAVTNVPIQLTLSTPQPSQTQMRSTPSTWRFRSATTINSNIQNPEPITRLPPITNERVFSNDQLMINRSNTITTAIVESNPPATRVVSGTSTVSNYSSLAKLRTFTNVGKLQKSSRAITISSNKDLNNSLTGSPTRSITTTTIPTTILKTTPVTRTNQQQQQQQQKRPLLTTKAPPPPPSSGAIKVPATHIC